ncbi:Protein of unknown function [Streptomyces sp. LcepLS]|nr:Protein of unknown function [Streptomyces sp. TverLS-915]SCE91009.1 Protein of unknown function [Streptomyces sp. LcepLS]
MPQGVGRFLTVGARPFAPSGGPAARAVLLRAPYRGGMYTRRRRAYFLMMGICLVLFVSAWAFVRIWSVPAAIGMCVVALVIPPVAAIVANRRGPEDRWWDEKDGEDGKDDEDPRRRRR